MRVDITAFGDGTAGRVAFGNEDGTFVAGVGRVVIVFLFGLGGRVVQVDAAVAQLAVVQIGFLGTFAGQLGNAGNGFALFFALLNLLQDDVGNLQVLVEIVVYVFLDEITYELVDTDSREGEFLPVTVFFGRHDE